MKPVNDNVEKFFINPFFKQWEMWLITVLFLGCSILSISYKCNYHCDEIFSYGLSNCVIEEQTVGMPVEEFYTYENASDPYMNYVTVHRGEGFNYKNVWKNQTNDVHPPLYYALLHTICSLTPDVFSKWQAGIINIVFGYLALIYMAKLCKKIYPDVSRFELFGMGLMAIYPLMTIVVFLRMYVMVLWFITYISYLFVDFITKDKITQKDYIKLIVISILGALTHYYCIFYLVLISITYFGFQIKAKKKDQGIRLLLLETLAGVISLVIFPAMIGHMFFGYRGTETISNSLSLDLVETLSRFKDFILFLNRDVFGYVLPLIILVIILIKIIKPKHSISMGVDAFFLLIPSILFFLFVSKSAAYVHSRYITPVYYVFLVIVIPLFFNAVKVVINNKHTNTFIAAFLIVSIIFQWINVNEQLYRETIPLINESKKYSSVNAVFVYAPEGTWTANAAFMEAINYNSITFINVVDIDKMSELYKYNDDDELIFIVAYTAMPYIVTVENISSQYSDYDCLGAFGTNTIYHAHN